MRPVSLWLMFAWAVNEGSFFGDRVAPSWPGDLARETETAVTAGDSEFPMLKSPKQTIQVSDIRQEEFGRKFVEGKPVAAWGRLKRAGV